MTVNLWNNLHLYTVASVVLVAESTLVSTLLQPLSPPLGSPQPLVYAELQSVKQTGPQPPPKEDPVLYSQLKQD